MLLAVTILLISILLNFLFGDPSPNEPSRIWFRIHPTVLIGTYIQKLESHFRSSNPRIEKVNGVLLALVVILTFALPVLVVLGILLTYLSLLLYGFFAVLILKFTITIKLETEWAQAVAKAIAKEDLEEARKYAHFSRRESKNLTGSQIGSAVIESMSENLIDFKLSPILAYSFLGVSGAVAFRALNTLDGTVGFKDPEHINIGWFSAKLDTIVNFIPARIIAALIIVASFILGEDYKNGWTIAKRDNRNTPSLNHGWPMAVMAGALRIRLEKPGKYILGDPVELLTSDKILRALRIRNLVIVLSVLMALPIIWVIRLFFFPF
jgi:adenosylcobinamide-phosphate synthase